MSDVKSSEKRKSCQTRLDLFVKRVKTDDRAGGTATSTMTDPIAETSTEMAEPQEQGEPARKEETPEESIELIVIESSQESSDTTDDNIEEFSSSDTEEEVQPSSVDLETLQEVPVTEKEDNDKDMMVEVNKETSNIDSGVTSLLNSEDKDMLLEASEETRNFDHEESKASSKEDKEVMLQASEEARNFDNEESKASSKEDKEVVLEASKDTGSKSEEDVIIAEDNEEETQFYELLGEEDESPVRLGEDFDSLLRAPGCCRSVKKPRPSHNHKVLFVPGQPLVPYPPKEKSKDIWDNEFVRLPCSRYNAYQVKGGGWIYRWDVIREALGRPIATSYDLENAIKSYWKGGSNFGQLHVLIKKMTPEENKEFFEFTLPGIINLALRLPEIFTTSPPLLTQRKEVTITMSQHQVSCLLACAFLCMLPKRYGIRKDHATFPSINFAGLFQLDDNGRPRLQKLEKIKCILHYFKRVIKQVPCGIISFRRHVLEEDENPEWHSSQKRLCRLRVTSDGTIEDDAPGMLQVDFANKFIGGGVLGNGCVQEEIRFVICPELIISRLFTEELERNECLIVYGVERFSDYVGYGSTFQWAGNHDDKTPMDVWGRRYTTIVAIDATPRIPYADQFSIGKIRRELGKAYVGFISRDTNDHRHMPAVATGNWGCGAFGGDPELKSLIQIMAASQAGRDVLYFTFNNKEFAQRLHDVHSLLREEDVTIGVLWKELCRFQARLSSDEPPTEGFFAYIDDLVEWSRLMQ